MTDRTTLENSICIVDSKYFACGLTDGSQRDNSVIVEAKMIPPLVRSRIKEPSEFPGRVRDGTNVRPLMSITKCASKCQVRFGCFSTMLLCDNVVDLAAAKRIRLKYQAIFAPGFRTFDYKPTKVSRYIRGHSLTIFRAFALASLMICSTSRK